MKKIARKKAKTTTLYFEASYLKYGDTRYFCLMATSLEFARVRAKTHVNNLGGKFLDVVLLDQENLGKSLHWSNKGPVQPKSRRAKSATPLN